MDNRFVRSSELTWQGCRRCRRRENCPYLRGERRRCAQARLLDAGTERLLEAISRAEDVGALLRADEELERTLERVLVEDLTWAETL